MATHWTLAGKEVPITGSDAVRWIDVSVPSSSNVSVDGVAATSEDRASCSVIGDPPLYLIWRIHKAQPQTLELLELTASKEFPRVGLRFSFPRALYPFAFICKNEITGTSRFPYLLYVLDVSGVAYLLRIRNVSAYASCSIIPVDELLELNLHDYFSNQLAITAVTATARCLIVGTNDGSVFLFQLGVLDPSAPGFVHELKDEAGIGRLWGLISRGKMVGTVQDLVISELHGKKYVFALHLDGSLRVWDLLSHNRVLSHNMDVMTVTGANFVRLWAGQSYPDSSIIPLAILRRHSDENSEMISLHSILYNFGDRTVFSMEPSVQNIPLEEGRCLDVKLMSDKIWILKDDGLVSQLLPTNNDEIEAFSYALQEEYVADQLFQSSEHLADEILRITHSIFSSSKDNILPFVSSIFVRRLLLPGVHHNAALYATLVEYNRHLGESELQTLTADGLKKEILSLIEHEVGSEKVSILHCWKCFFARYFHNWCKNNALYGLLVDSSADAVGLIRKSSVSLFRSLEDVERIVEGSSDEVSELTGLVDLFDDDIECEIMVDLLRCAISFSQQLGKTASSIFYESLLTAPDISSEDIVHCIVKILQTGYCIPGPMLQASTSGDHAIVLEKELTDHKSYRKLSIDMFLSLQGLYKKASSWDKILNVIEGFLKFLVPQKIMLKFDSEMSSNINSSIIVHSAYQIAKVMFESAWDFLLLLSYLVDISGQVHLLPDDITKIQLELVPMLQEIIFEWLIIIFFAITPAAPAVTEDFNSKLSSLQIDNNMGKQLWNEKLGRCDFTLAFVFLLNVGSSSKDRSHFSSDRFSNMQNFICRMRDFISWIIWGQAGGSSTFLSRSIDLAFILFKHDQYGAAEQLLMMAEGHLLKEKTSQSIQDADGGWCIRHHLLGCCLLAQVQYGLHATQKEKKVSDAIRCFFRSSSGNGASEALQSLSVDMGIPYLGFTGSTATAVWKLHYYQWAMQLFERFNISDGACQFALAALEQVDEALCMKDEMCTDNTVNESVTTIKGRLWANVFIFALDLGRYYDAYCAIISNPDEESKYICLRRFIIVLYEQGAIKILCSNKLPLIGLVEKVEQELAWKAERSDISAKPNLYKLLYAFQLHRHNWQRAANYIYMYSARLRTEAALKDNQGSSLMLQERLNALSAAVNALHLVHPAYAWIDPLAEKSSLMSEQYPSKKAKRTPDGYSDNDAEPQSWQSTVDIEKLENEFVLTSAEYMLSLANVKWTFSGDLVLQLINDILDLSKVESGAMKLEATKFRPREVVKHVLQTAAASLQKMLILEGNVADDIPIEVTGDVLRIRQILTNLVSNAVKFTHQGKVGINLYVVQEPPFSKTEEGHQKVTTDQSIISANGVKEEKHLSSPRTRCDQKLLDGIKHNHGITENHALNDECRSSVNSECSMNDDTEEKTHSTEATVWIRCDVYDTGIGIPEKAIPTLFRRYMQASADHARKYGGTGLGLAICKQLVELMGGSLTVSSKENCGSTFTFILPYKVSTACDNFDDPDELSDVENNEDDLTEGFFQFQPRTLGSLFSSNGSTRPKNILPGYRTSQKYNSFPENSHSLLSSNIGSNGTSLVEDASSVIVDAPDMSESTSSSDHSTETKHETLVNGNKQNHDKAHASLQNGSACCSQTKEANGEMILEKKSSEPQQTCRDQGKEDINSQCVVSSSSSSTLSEATKSTLKPNILLVEDNKINIMVTRSMMKQLGYSMDVVNNGVEAIQAVQRQSYDIILMDVYMPVMNGLQTTRLIRSYEQTGNWDAARVAGIEPSLSASDECPVPPKKRIQIVAMTANTMSESAEECFANGMDSFVSKPVTFQKLKDCLEQYLS